MSVTGFTEGSRLNIEPTSTRLVGMQGVEPPIPGGAAPFSKNLGTDAVHVALTLHQRLLPASEWKHNRAPLGQDRRPGREAADGTKESDSQDPRDEVDDSNYPSGSS